MRRVDLPPTDRLLLLPRCPLPSSRRARCSAAVARCRAASGEEEPPNINEDVRDFRARLVAREREDQGAMPEGAAGARAVDGWAYETPLIEQGAVLLGGTKQVFGFGLRQQYFHKVQPPSQSPA